jgi:acylglycerol lipase
VSAPDGTELVGSAWKPSGTARGVLVVVHGLKDHAQRYGELAARANALGVAVYGFDLRGHGRSAGARAWIGRFGEYLADLDTVLVDVRPAHPDAPLFVLGHSMGGAIVTQYVLERSPRVAGVVLSAPALRPPANVSKIAIGFTKFLGSVAPHAAIFRLPDRDFSRDPAVVQAMGADPLISQTPAPARTAAELLRTMAWIRSRESSFSVPVLALHGTADRLTHPEGSRDFIAHVAARSKTLRSYPGLFHDLMHEPERATVLGDIVDWLAPRLG